MKEKSPLRRTFLQIIMVSLSSLFLGRETTVSRAEGGQETDMQLLSLRNKREVLTQHPELIPEDLNNVIHLREALDLLLSYGIEYQKFGTPITIGWLDFAPGIIDDSVVSLLLPTSPLLVQNYEPTHIGLSSHFGVQINDHGQPGLAQAEWSQLDVRTIANKDSEAFTPQAFENWKREMHTLIDSGVGVIGVIPSWRASDFPPDTDIEQLKTEIRELYKKAEDKNIIVALAAGNANSDLRGVDNERILHTVAEEFENVLIVGGVNQDRQRAVWEKDGRIEGSNYGDGVCDISSVATKRIVPGSNQIRLDGTTFALGDVVAAIQAVQMILTKNGQLPGYKKVKSIVIDQSNWSEEMGNVLDMERVIGTAIQKKKESAIKKYHRRPQWF